MRFECWGCGREMARSYYDLCEECEKDLDETKPTDNEEEIEEEYEL